MSTRLPYASAVATGRGDDGTTSLLFSAERISKDDARTEAYGTIDEAVAALGLARAELGMKAQYGVLSPNFGGLGPLLLRLQRELFTVAAELATDPAARDRARDGETRVSAGMVSALDAVLAETEAAIDLPREFVIPGETRVSAALEIARTVVRRAERRAVTVARVDRPLADGHLLPYLNRLADLLWILARVAEGAEAKAPVAARSGRPRTRSSRPASPERTEA